MEKKVTDEDKQQHGGNIQRESHAQPEVHTPSDFKGGKLKQARRDAANALQEFMSGLNCGGDGRNAFGAGNTYWPEEGDDGPLPEGSADDAGSVTGKAPPPPLLPRDLLDGSNKW